MSRRKTFDASAYHEALDAFDGIHCVECGSELIPREQRHPRPHPRSVLAKCCSRACEEAFVERTVLDWSKIRERIFKRDSYTCQDCGRNTERAIIVFRFIRRSNIRLSQPFPREPKYWWKFVGRFEVVEPVSLEVHHIVPLSEGGPEFDLDNLVTLCFDCHHLGRHGSKAPTPEEKARQKAVAERERLNTVRSRHTCLDRFQEAAV